MEDMNANVNVNDESNFEDENLEMSRQDVGDVIDDIQEHKAELSNEQEQQDSKNQPELHLVEEASEANAEITNEQIIEAILFSSDNPVSASKLASIIGILGSREIRKLVANLNDSYERMGASFRIEEIAGGYQMMTRPEFAPYLQRLYKVRAENKLSSAALETLAVIAYKQPVVRAEIEAIRGVACGEIIRSLLEKGLIKIVGRAEELGRPMLYGTTKRFLQVFGLPSLNDLPKVPELNLPSDSDKSSSDDSKGADDSNEAENGKSNRNDSDNSNVYDNSGNSDIRQQEQEN